MQCAVAIDTNAYYAKQAKLQQIGNMASDLLEIHVATETAPGAKYDPFSADNVIEALNDTAQPQLDKIARALAASDAQGLLQAMRETTQGYWKDHARQVFAHVAEEDARTELSRY